MHSSSPPGRSHRRIRPSAARGVGHMVERADRRDHIEAARVGVPRANVALVVCQPPGRAVARRTPSHVDCARVGVDGRDVVAGPRGLEGEHACAGADVEDPTRDNVHKCRFQRCSKRRNAIRAARRSAARSSPKDPSPASRWSASASTDSELGKKSAALGISRSGGARNPHVFQHTLRFLRSGGTRRLFARDDFFTSSQALWARGKVRFFKCTRSNEIAAGVMPEIREACPSVAGRYCDNF